MGYLFMALMVLLTVYGQMIFKWQIDQLEAFPPDLGGKAVVLLRFLLRPWVISAFLAAFLASLAWMGALLHFDLSYAYPFTSFSFALVLVLSVIFFGEQLTWAKMAGIAIIALGIFVGSR